MYLDYQLSGGVIPSAGSRTSVSKRGSEVQREVSVSGSAVTLRSKRRASKRLAVAVATITGALAMATPGGVSVHAAPGAGFVLNVADMRFILKQIEIAEAHASTEVLDGNGVPTLGGVNPATSVLGNGPNDVPNALLPWGLRQVDGRNNNLFDGRSEWGASDTPFLRTSPSTWRTTPAAMSISAGNYGQRGRNLADLSPRIISNLIADQSANNPAALAAGTGTDGDSVFIPNVAPNAGVGAPYNGLFVLFGQFFDHGLDLVPKLANESVVVPLESGDPLFEIGKPNIMVASRTKLDQNSDGTNLTTPWIDQNQTYTSHPSHQAFLREYVMVNGKPVATGKLLDGGACASGALAHVCNLPTWTEVKAQAAAKLGILLTDTEVTSVPLLLTDEYGRFLRGPHGFPQLVKPDNSVVEGDPNSPVSASQAQGTGHAFLDDIAHTAVPGTKTPDGDSDVGNNPPAGTYDNELLGAHFITGDGRGNENIGLSAIHTVFHAEHNRLWADIQNVIASSGDNAFISQWKLASGAWNGERLFQASRFVNEMEYQHLVFGEFVRKFQPGIRPFAAYDPTLRPDITAEFAHAVYRFGHSQLNATVKRIGPTGENWDLSLLDAFLDPPALNAGMSSPAEAVGSVARGMSQQVGNEIDEFVTNTLRNSLLGLPLDLATLNIVRGRDTGLGSLNGVRRMLYAQTTDPSLQPYANWNEFGLNLRHPDSLVNFIAAYGRDSSILNATTSADRRSAATALLNDANFMYGQNAWADVNGRPSTGVEDIDLWIGGLAESRTPFGGMLGSTFDFIFRTQMENLQEGDRFYYLGRTAGMNLGLQLEGNLFSEIIARNSTADTLPADAFLFPALTFNLPDTTGLTESAPGSGRWRYVGSKHVVMNGTSGVDGMWAGGGNDTLRGNAGNDWAQGDLGDDQIIGGAGNDILLDSSGADLFFGGDGDDVMSGGGPGVDSFLGGSGNDAVIAGGYGTAVLSGPGSDFGLGGTDADVMNGDDGVDWLEGGAGADSLTGDAIAPFSLDLIDSGRDVLIGGSNDDLLSGGGLGDISLAGPGVDQFLGDFGFDWQTYASAVPANDEIANVDLNLLVPAPGDIQAGLNDGFQDVEAISGGSKNDIIRGDARIDLTSPTTPGFDDVLTAADLQAIRNLSTLLRNASSWSAGNILIGGGGSDILEGRAGDDFINGDAFLQVWLSVPTAAGISGTPDPADGTRVLVPSLTSVRQALIDRGVTPSQLGIVRSITLNAGAAGVDVAAFSGRRANYTISLNPDWSLTVVDLTGIDGTDTLVGIETLRFTDGDVNAPSSPQNVRMTGATSTSLTMAWAPPVTAASAPFTGYRARAFAPGGLTPLSTCYVTSGTNSCTIPGLVSGQTYHVDVVTEGANGISPPAPAPRMIVAMAPPAAPLSVSALAIKNGATISWQSSGSPGTVASFSARAFSTPTSTTVVKSCTTTTALTCSLTALTNGVTYYVEVVATNSFGSSKSGRVPAALVVPARPTGVVGTPGSASATVSWNPVATVSGGSPVTSYTARAYTASSLGKLLQSCTTSTTSCTIPSLPNGTTVYVEVTATNAIGTSPASSPRVAVVLPAGVPSAPRNPVVYSGIGRAIVSWTAPSSNGGSAIINYTARAWSALSGGTLVNSCTTTTLNCSILGLTRGITYYVDVVATNAKGVSAPSTPRQAVLPT